MSNTNILSLREWRRAKEISQEQMAQKLGIHVNTYLKWEQDPHRINIQSALKIVKILNVPIDNISFENNKVKK